MERSEGSDSNYLSLSILGGQQFSGEERNVGTLEGYVFASWTKSSIGIVSGNSHLLAVFHNKENTLSANTLKVGGVTRSVNEDENSSDLKLESDTKQMVIQQGRRQNTRLGWYKRLHKTWGKGWVGTPQGGSDASKHLTDAARLERAQRRGVGNMDVTEH